MSSGTVLMPVAEHPTPRSPGPGPRSNKGSPRRRTSTHNDPHDTTNISGTTFVAHDSDHEMRDLDPGLAAEMLHDISLNSKVILSCLANPKKCSNDNTSYEDILKPFNVPGFGRKFQLRVNLLEDAKASFTRDHFISRPSARKVLPSIRGQRHELYAACQKANLAQLAVDFISPSERNLKEVFLELDSLFPSPFVASFTSNEAHDPTTSNFKDETFIIGLEIRTQHLLAELKAARDDLFYSDPNIIISRIFHTLSGDEEQPKFQGWDIDGLRDPSDMEAVPGELSHIVLERIEKIRESCIDIDTEYVDLEKLEALFPWSSFIVRLSKWICSRTAEIDEQLKRLQHEESVSRTLHMEATGQSSPDRSKNVSIPPALPPNSPRKTIAISHTMVAVAKPAVSTAPGEISKRRSSLLSGAAVRHLKKRKSLLDAAASTEGGKRSEARRSDKGDGKGYLDILKETRLPEPVKPTTSGAAVPEVVIVNDSRNLSSRSPASKTAAARAKQKSFNDRQLNAGRVSPISQGAPDKTPSRKRRAPEPDDDFQAPHLDESEEEESGFETYQDKAGPSRKRAPQRQEPAAKRPRLEPREPVARQRPVASATSPGRHSNTTSTEGTQVRQRSASHQTREKSTPSPRPKMFPGRRFRMRTEWTLEEVNQVERLIADIGPFWSAIKKEDEADHEPKLLNRSTANIKDKAMTIAFQCRRDRRSLPRNFDHIRLRERDREELRQRGIDYVEEGVDEEA
ncbi:hypothetical protein AJ80_08651 [Polytolypa hystricis UAMH7299]|uniref:Myb-like domain-containing protein n=1 Tax=Polytolypa hystricis (strain UAMH7299) TaxID=1447883 RepID=A0A2B7X442_POLH7|nr:hypothetical protein AJ80_08651 [Polytolypa hystricis UAMH7299]